MPPTEQTIRIAAPAKINLSLAVGNRCAADGRHEIDAPSVPVDICDQIWATEAPAIGSRLIGMQTPDSELAARAVAALAAAAGIRRGLNLVIEKRIPAGAGLGGASSDAAAALLAANRLWGLNWSPAALAALAARLGSDIPFFIGCRPARITGTGERLVPLAETPSGWCVLVLPPVFCSTAAVYARYAQDASAKISRRIRKSADNDLLPAALAVAPELAGLMAAAGRLAGRPAQLTGSGSGFFFLAADATAAAALAARLAGRIEARIQTAVLLAGRPGRSLHLGSSQAVRQRILAPPCAGSNPASPA